MGALLVLLFMIIVGAAIGGITNSIAIKMLFRPYEAKYIGRFKVPFTPGLIPKRQQELAKQMGEMVIKHLLTPEGLKRKINNKRFFNHSLQWIEIEMDGMLKKDISIEQLIEKLHIPINSTSLEAATKSAIQTKLKLWLEQNKDRKLKEIVSKELIIQLEFYLPKISNYILVQLDQYIQSEEGKEKIGRIANQYLGNRGFFGNIVSSFLGGDGLADKIQPAISQFLQSEDARKMINRLLYQEHQKLLDNEIEQLQEMIDKHNLIEKVSDVIVSFISFEELLQIKLYDVYIKFEPTLKTKLLPRVVSMVQQYLTEKMGAIMERMNLQDIVREEVEQFDVKRLEEMVLGITKRELKMITYLGSLLGGVIGLIQGLIVMLLT